VLVPKALKDTFIAKAREVLIAAYGNENRGDLAAIVNERHYRRLQSLITPGEIRVGEDNLATRRLAPRLLPDADWESLVMQEEIFGPILPVIAYASLDEALKALSALPSPLALYAFSRNRQTLEHIAGSVRSGSICFNDVLKQATNLNLPFGGVGNSGMGRYRGRAGFECFSYQRSVTRRYFCRDFFRLMPPYGDRLEKLRRLLK